MINACQMFIMKTFIAPVAAAMNMIPSKTGAAAAVGLVIPALVGQV